MCDGTPWRFSLCDSQSWTGDSRTSASHRAQVWLPGGAVFSFADGMIWTLDGRLDARVEGLVDFSNGEALAVAAPATLAVTADGLLRAPTVRLDGGSLTVAEGAVLDVGTVCASENGSQIAGEWALARAQTILQIDDGATLAFAAHVWKGHDATPRVLALTGAGALTVVAGGVLDGVELGGFSGSLTVAAGGRLLLDSAADIPDGVTVRCEDGGIVLLRTRSAQDAEKIDGTISSVITAATVAEAEVTVASGETLYVEGGGLTERTQLIQDGGTLTFLSDACIASPVSIRASSEIVAMGGVTGTVAGAVSAVRESAATCSVTGAGVVSFTGGGTFDRVSLMAEAGGAIRLAGGSYSFVRVGTVGLDGGRHFEVCDGAELNGLMTADPPVLLVKGSQEGATATFEAAAGGVVSLKSSWCIYLQNYGRLLLDGGTIHLEGLLRFWAYGISTRFDFRAGLLETDTPIHNVVTWHTIDIDWTGCTWRLLAAFPGNRETKDYTGVFMRHVRQCVRIGGPNCVLDVGGKERFSLVNDSGTGQVGDGPVWQEPSEDACLTVTNAGHFVVNGLASNMALRVACSRVTLASLGTAKIRELAIAGQGTTVTTTNDAVAVETLRVVAGGSWQTGVTLGSGIVAENAVFEDGATIAADGTTSVWNLPGTLTLPAWVQTSFVGTFGDAPLIAAQEVVGAAPETVRASKTKKRYLELVGNVLRAWQRGLMMMVH